MVLELVEKNRQWMYDLYIFVIQYIQKVVNNMKKIIPILAVLGSAAAFAVYKMKKDEQKRIVELDQGLLTDEDLTDIEEIEEGPISTPESCCSVEDVKDFAEESIDFVKAKADNAFDKAKEFGEDAIDKVEAFSEEFPHLVEEEIETLKKKANEIISNLEISGDVHEHERPVQHCVSFTNLEDLEAFKNEVINKGFVITAGDSELELVVLHITPINTVKLISNILFIANEAKHNHGTYLGWTSKVIY